MDDFNLQNLNESRNEWVARLVTIMTPSIFQGLKQIFDDSVKLSGSTNQKDKYLMTFQNMLTQIPKWNNDIIEAETQRIKETTHCNYIEDLITCVHVIQLKALTCVRVSQNEKDVEINIPKLNDFVHRVYINTARVIYSNIYLFEQEIMPIQIQQNYNKVDQIIKENIIQTIRQSMPIEELLRAYLEETVSKALDNKSSPQKPSSSPSINLEDDDTSTPLDTNPNTSGESKPSNEDAFDIAANNNVEQVPSTLNELEEIQISANDNIFDPPEQNDSSLTEYDPVQENDEKGLSSDSKNEPLTEHSVSFSGIPDNDSFTIHDEDITSNDNDVLLGIETLA